MSAADWDEDETSDAAHESSNGDETDEDKPLSDGRPPWISEADGHTGVRFDADPDGEPDEPPDAPEIAEVKLIKKKEICRRGEKSQQHFQNSWCVLYVWVAIYLEWWRPNTLGVDFEQM
jgi:hypothetical protein